MRPPIPLTLAFRSLQGAFYLAGSVASFSKQSFAMHEQSIHTRPFPPDSRGEFPNAFALGLRGLGAPGRKFNKGKSPCKTWQARVTSFAGRTPTS